MENDLLVLEAPSVVVGFRILNLLPNAKLIDAEPIGGGRFLILLRGSSQALLEIAKNSDAAEFEVIEQISQAVLDAVYSLAPTKIGESFIVAETESATAMFSLAQILVAEHGLLPIEIKIRKSGTGGAYAYFTGACENCAPAAEAARTRLKAQMKNGRLEVFDQPSAALRSLFGA
jgi:hypothetical protein